MMMIQEQAHTLEQILEELRLVRQQLTEQDAAFEELKQQFGQLQTDFAEQARLNAEMKTEIDRLRSIIGE